jgi:hypothetical protein
MKRVKMSIGILHIANDDSKAYTWRGLIFAATSELARIKARSKELRGAIRMFRKNEKEGVPCVLQK